MIVVLFLSCLDCRLHIIWFDLASNDVMIFYSLDLENEHEWQGWDGDEGSKDERKHHTNENWDEVDFYLCWMASMTNTRCESSVVCNQTLV